MIICLEKELNQEPMTTIPIPCFREEQEEEVTKVENTPTLVAGVQKHAIEFGTFSQSGMLNYPGYQITEIHLGKFPDPTEFQS